MFSITGYSGKTDVHEAVMEATASMTDEYQKLIIFFSDYTRFVDFNASLHEMFPDSLVVGAVSEMVASPGKLIYGGLVVSAFSDDIEVSYAILNNASVAPVNDVAGIRDALDKVGAENTAAFLLNCGNTYSDDKVSDCIYLSINKLQIPVFGGSAAARPDQTIDDAFPRGEISCNGRVYKDDSIIIFMHNNRGKIRIYSANIYTPMGYSFQVTDADVRKKTVYELNYQPAVKVLSKALGCRENDLIETLRYHPLGRSFGNTNLIGEAARMTNDGGIEFRVRFYNQTKVDLMEPVHYEENFKNTLDRINRENKKGFFSIVCSCISQVAFLQRSSWFESLLDNFSESLEHYICFFPYGEQFNYVYMNQTTVFAVFENNK